MNWTTIYALTALLGLVVGYSLTVYFSSYHNRFRFKKRVKCLFGFHEAGPIRDESFDGFGHRVQRCDWCDRIIHKFEVNDNKIRRIY